MTIARKHADIEHLAIGSLKTHAAPGAFVAYGKFYLEAGIAADAGRAGYNPAKHYLLCHSLELGLKGFLCLKGHPMIGLSEGKYGHNLERLLEAADREGLSTYVKLTSDQRGEIKKASDYFREKVFQYPAIVESAHAYPKSPDYDLLISASSMLLDGIRPPCSAV
jgi:hypothetical protein